MTGFSPGWLALRAPFDGRARDKVLAQRFAASLPRLPLIVDLGAGTGASAAALALLVDPTARFRLVDNDGALLDIARTRSTQFETVVGDLARDLDRLTAGADAITASALMDLVSDLWFDTLAAIAASRRLPLLFTLSVDGRHALTPEDADDGSVFAAFAQDQRRDKGLGRALGPDAPGHMHERLKMLGAKVSLAQSDWQIGRDGHALMAAFIDGVAEAAARAAPAGRTAIAAWLTRRQKQIGDGSLSITVGHQDLLALW